MNMRDRVAAWMQWPLLLGLLAYLAAQVTMIIRGIAVDEYALYRLLLLAGLWAIAHNTQVAYCECTHCAACHEEE